jgi:hypothetical protein
MSAAALGFVLLEGKFNIENSLNDFPTLTPRTRVNSSYLRSYDAQLKPFVCKHFLL